VPPGRAGLLTPRLTRQRYLVGNTITEADIRLFTTLVRFDAVHHGHFKCNRWKLTENQVLWGYVRDLYQTPGFGDTVDFVGPADRTPPRGAGRPAVRRRDPARAAVRRPPSAGERVSAQGQP
jgi:glutathione S-transferase